ncbi:MAG: ArsB/NhaD family transporter [Candidatus Omnitrophica bacterium]|nr:ArsB/NhaD family transporter [Candidatus Omnitrophota bacterium]
MNPFIIGVSIFILVYSGIIFERVHKTVAALLGAATMLCLHIVSQEEAFQAIDLNVIFLLIGMMIIVHIIAETGVFQWAAIRIAQLGGGEPLKILILLSITAAILSAFLDNVTTIIVMAPIMFILADTLEVDPIPFLIMSVIASNIGGAATLVGDPPNILIGSAGNLSFNDFLYNLAPVIIVIMCCFYFTVKFLFRNTFHVSSELKGRIIEMRADRAITNPALLRKALAVIAAVILLFLIHHRLGLEVATIALSGAAVLLLLSRTEPEEVFRHLEWTTIFFFIGLFIIVEGLVKIGFIELVANHALTLTGGNVTTTTLLLLWFSGIFSAVIDNIPYTATMIPLVKHVGISIAKTMQVAPQTVMNPLWWSLALGACLGGNGTVIGASANVIIVGLAKKNGYKISFFRFFKYGVIFLIESMIISTVYLYLRYL